MLLQDGKWIKLKNDPLKQKNGLPSLPFQMKKDLQVKIEQIIKEAGRETTTTNTFGGCQSSAQTQSKGIESEQVYMIRSLVLDCFVKLFANYESNYSEHNG